MLELRGEVSGGESRGEASVGPGPRITVQHAEAGPRLRQSSSRRSKACLDTALDGSPGKGPCFRVADTLGPGAQPGRLPPVQQVVPHPGPSRLVVHPPGVAGSLSSLRPSLVFFPSGNKRVPRNKSQEAATWNPSNPSSGIIGISDSEEEAPLHGHQRKVSCLIRLLSRPCPSAA